MEGEREREREIVNEEYNAQMEARVCFYAYTTKGGFCGSVVEGCVCIGWVNVFRMSSKVVC